MTNECHKSSFQVDVNVDVHSSLYNDRQLYAIKTHSGDNGINTSCGVCVQIWHQFSVNG